MSRLVARFLPDGRRLHILDGPIDLIVEAWGTVADVHRALEAAVECARPVLDDLCAELSALRAPQPGPAMQGTVARRMQCAVAPYAARTFITPMAAVAGAVAEHVLGAMVASATLARAYVNNGGDISIHLAPGQTFDVAMAELGGQGLGSIRVQSADLVRGIATSGWPGRSYSLGIADSVTVLAATASQADAAATVIANAVDLPHHPGVQRVAARALSPDSDLGDRLVTRAVARLSATDRHTALATGAVVASDLIRSRLIAAAALYLQGEAMVRAMPSLRAPSDIRIAGTRNYLDFLLQG